MLHLSLISKLEFPLEVEGVLPAKVATLSCAQLGKMPVYYGNRTEELGQFFEIRGDCTYGEIHFKGDLRLVRRLGEKLDSGRVFIEGDVGFHCGARMSGGEIVIRGHADHWLGAEMTGGRIRVLGSAGNHVGGAYVGSKFGQRGGEILISGDAGDELGVRMRRGLIAVAGNVGRFAGLAMIAGTIIGLKQVGSSAGAAMKRGTLLMLETPEIAPGFAYSCAYRPAYLGLLLKQLQQSHFEAAHHLDIGQVACYRGDRLTGGRGELLIAQRESAS